MKNKMLNREESPVFSGEIEELKKRIEELEKRCPIYLPIQYPINPQPWYPDFPYGPNRWNKNIVWY